MIETNDDKRQGQIKLATVQVTYNELKNIHTILHNPPEKLDMISSVLSIVSALIFINQIILGFKDWYSDKWLLALLALCILLASISFYKIVKNIYEKHFNKDSLYHNVLEHVEKMLGLLK